jgi:hypothetical protein
MGKHIFVSRDGIRQRVVQGPGLSVETVDAGGPTVCRTAHDQDIVVNSDGGTEFKGSSSNWRVYLSCGQFLFERPTASIETVNVRSTAGRRSTVIVIRRTHNGDRT